ncbi:MAG TPA: sigma-70 family RNA polymerase sigma factor [Polyangia bacterium]|jgi:RNA polymerase sigma-70 factor (ECF subfamily)
METLARYAPALCRKARRMLGNAADAEDVVQTVFAELVQRGRVGADLPYLFRAVTSRCLNLVRDQGNRRRLIERQAPALRGAVRVRCDDEVIGTDLMLKLVDRLDAATAEVLVYRYFDDLTQDEIAELQDVSRKTVAARLERVRQAVHALIGERRGSGGGATEGA